MSLTVDRKNASAVLIVARQVEKKTQPVHQTAQQVVDGFEGASLQVLRKGARGEAVKELQTLLKARGFEPGTIDGAFGSKTAEALKSFQKAAGLKADGVVGPKTWAALTAAAAAPPATPTPATTTPAAGTTSSDLAFGATGESVKELQNLLNHLGFNSGKTDGAFGARTQEAVRSLQQAAGLTVNGVVDAATWSSLRSGKGVDGTPVVAPATNTTAATGAELEVFPLAGMTGGLNDNYNKKFKSGATRASGHLGIDIYAPRGAQVVAPVSGTVVKAGWSDYSGNTVVIRRGNTTFYLCHLDTIPSNITKGVQVSAGTPIGTVGSTGTSTSVNHLHFSIYKGSDYYGGSINPYASLKAVLQPNQ